MKIIDVIARLIAMGYDVKARKRRDGSYRITKINGQTYTGSSGNAVARSLVGAQLSEARVRQLGKIRTPKGRFGNPKRAQLGEDVKKRIRKVQRLFKKRGSKEGMPTRRGYRYNLEHYGREEAERLLDQAYRRAQGLAYDANIDALIARIERLGRLRGIDTSGIVRKIESKRSTFKDEFIQDINEINYNFENRAIDAGTWIAAINDILNRL